MRPATAVPAAVLVGAVALEGRKRARRRAADRAAARAREHAPDTSQLPPRREREVVTEDGVRLHVDEYGPEHAAAAVVLLHGYHQSSRLWADQVRDLSAARPDLRILTYDHRGHGRSGRTTREAARIEQLGRDLVRVLDELVPAGPVVLVGHSMGGMTLMALAEHRPELFGPRVVGVGFVATSSGGLRDVALGLPSSVARHGHRALALMNERALRAEQAGRPRRLPPGTARTIFARGASPEHVRLVLEDMADCSAETVAFFHGTFLDHDRVAALQAIDVPTVVIGGDRDLLCPAAHSRTIADALPQAELTILPGAGHMVQFERRAEVSRRLGELVDRTLPRSVAHVAAERPG